MLMFKDFNMDLIMAQSQDGYFAKDENDDMKWTGKQDKEIFQLKNRKIWVVRSKNAGWLVNNGQLINEITFGQINNKMFNNAKVIGGPTLAKAVIDAGYINYAYISVIPKKLNKGLGKELTEILNKFQYTSIKIGELEIRKYKLKGEKI